MFYNFDLKTETKHFTVEIATTDRYGFFEHHRLGDGCGGGLWFDENKELVDYDGVFELRMEVIEAIRELGYIVPVEFEPEPKEK